MVLAEIYKQRRQRLSQILNGEPAVFTAFSAMQQTNDSAGLFVQESSFFWLTGITEPDWQLIILDKKSWLVSPIKSDIHRIFDGGMSADEAQRISSVDGVMYEDDLKDMLNEAAKKHSKVSTVFQHPHSNDYDFVLNPALQKLHSRLQRFFSGVVDCRKALSKLKAIKSSEEIELMQQAIDISIEGFNEVRNTIAATHYEHEIEATLGYIFRSAGSEGHAYAPIVGTGKNACTLHYIANNDPLPVNGMVLIDAGARVGGYAADITRTYAIGTPSRREKDVHAEVERAHQAIIDLIKPETSVKEYMAAVDDIMKQALRNLNLLKTPDDFRRYFPHAISHGLGIDVHDSLEGFEAFQPGMVLTVEPGIYIPEEGIGVRIEDDILVTKDGNKNLSAALPTSL
jgi:Xaa-Pro aminopeptidase